MSEESRARHWRKSTRCLGGATECVEVASGVRVRDSKQPGGTVLTFAPDTWRAFTADPAAALRGAA